MNNKYTMDMQETIDRVTAERDAALGESIALRQNIGRVVFERDSSQRREASLAKDLENWKRKACESAEREQALQQRLTAADERVDVLEGLLRSIPEDLKELSGCENTAGVYACIDYIEQLVVSLKPAEGIVHE